MEVIETDPVMTLKVLKVINSAYFSLPHKITTVTRAVVYIGINTVKNLALSLAAVGILPHKNEAGFDMDAYLQHSLVTAGIARQLAQRYAPGDVDPMDCYIVALLHDFGKVVLAQNMPEEFSQAMKLCADTGMALHEAETKVIGVNHAVVGAMLVKRWNFPDDVVLAIRDHHDQRVADNLLSECLYLADKISKNVTDSKFKKAVDDNPEGKAKLLGLTVERATALLGDLDFFVKEAETVLQASVA
jgi:putative nucleotidyltransferase with HDIG domain